MCTAALTAVATGILAITGCQPAGIPTMILYETPQAFVRLETDPLADQKGHDHPARIPAGIMSAVLAGIVIEDPKTRLPLYDDLSLPRRRQALTEDEIARFAPLFSLALDKATPEEVVTFYESVRVSAARREVTSGGLFVDGEELHIFLSNLRSDTHYAADVGVADTEDDRLVPMRSIAPQRGSLSFIPASAARDAAPEGITRLSHWDRRELIILFNRLQPRPAGTAPPKPPSPHQTPGQTR